MSRPGQWSCCSPGALLLRCVFASLSPPRVELAIELGSLRVGRLRTAVPAPGSLEGGLSDGSGRHLGDHRRHVPAVALIGKRLERALRSRIQGDSDGLRGTCPPALLLHACDCSKNETRCNRELTSRRIAR